jgi:hypothetical protein
VPHPGHRAVPASGPLAVASLVLLLALATLLSACSVTVTDQARLPWAEAPVADVPADVRVEARPEVQAVVRAPGSGTFALAPREPATAVPAPPPVIELPRGGTEVFPRYRLYGGVGNPASPAFGFVGVGPVEDRAAEVAAQAAAWAGDREVLPVLELVVVVAQREPGPDGDHAALVDPAVIDDWLAAARSIDGLLLLDVQPGSAEWLPTVRQLEPWLVEPDVGLALDPEWAVAPGQVPGRVFGSMTGAEVDEVSAYLARIVDAGDLPQKVLVVHELAPFIVTDEAALTPRPQVAVVTSVDGIGSPAEKVATYDRVLRDRPDHVRPGFKLFLQEDVERGGAVMTPEQVLGLSPVPDYVIVE